MIGYSLVGLGVAWALAIGFVAGINHERTRWESSLGGCTFPKDNGALVVYRTGDGRIGCYRASSPFVTY